MSTRRVNLDRQTPMLVPPDLRPWVGEGDRVHSVLEAERAENEQRRQAREARPGPAEVCRPARRVRPLRPVDRPT